MAGSDDLSRTAGDPWHPGDPHTEDEPERPFMEEFTRRDAGDKGPPDVAMEDSDGEPSTRRRAAGPP